MNISPIMTQGDKLRETAKETCLLKLEHNVKNYKPLINGYIKDTDEDLWASTFISGYESAMRGEPLRYYASECFKRGYKAYKGVIE